MSPVPDDYDLTAERFPRPRGDEPTGDISLHDVTVFSPPARG